MDFTTPSANQSVFTKVRFSFWHFRFWVSETKDLFLGAKATFFALFVGLPGTKDVLPSRWPSALALTMTLSARMCLFFPFSCFLHLFLLLSLFYRLFRMLSPDLPLSAHSFSHPSTSLPPASTPLMARANLEITAELREAFSAAQRGLEVRAVQVFFPLSTPTLYSSPFFYTSQTLYTHTLFS